MRINKFQQKQICKALNLSKRRIEYLMIRANITPVIQAQGTGNTNFFDFAGVMSFSLANCLSSWGFNNREIISILHNIKKLYPEIFKNTELTELSGQDRILTLSHGVQRGTVYIDLTKINNIVQEKINEKSN